MNTYADVDTLVRLTDDAFCATLHAVLDGDPHAAAEVLRGSATRRRLLDAARATLRSRRWVPAPQVGLELRYVAQVGRVGTLVDQLARQVVEGRDAAIGAAGRADVERLLEAGRCRFRLLAEGPGCARVVPLRGTAAALFAVADHGVRDTSPTLLLCAALAESLLRASRLAAVA